MDKSKSKHDGWKLAENSGNLKGEEISTCAVA